MLALAEVLAADPEDATDISIIRISFRHTLRMLLTLGRRGANAV